jgi:hypothetical protein
MSQPASASREEQLVAGLCHAAILMPVLGIAVPLSVWLSQRERSALLRENALQALVFQLAGLGLSVVGYVCQFCGLFLLPLAAIFMPGSSSAPAAPADGSPFALIFPGIMNIGTCLAVMVQCIGWPLFMLLGVRAAWRIGHGYTFDYPWLSAWLRQHTYTTPHTPLPPASSDSVSAPTP